MKRILIVLLTVALCSCKSETPAPAAPAASATHFQEVVDVKQLMNWIMEPSSDVIWDAVGTVITAEGEENKRPETDEQWTAVRDAAAVVAESANLLLTPGRIRDEDDWVKHAHELTKAAQAAIAAAEAKDVDSLFTTGGDIYLACTACHEQYAIGLKKVE
jgi:cytochrome c553